MGSAFFIIFAIEYCNFKLKFGIISDILIIRLKIQNFATDYTVAKEFNKILQKP